MSNQCSMVKKKYVHSNTVLQLFIARLLIYRLVLDFRTSIKFNPPQPKILPSVLAAVFKSSIKKRCFCGVDVDAVWPDVRTLSALFFMSMIYAISVSWKMAEVMPGDIMMFVAFCFEATIFCEEKS